MITVNTAIVNNEWYFTYNAATKEILTIPTYIDSNTSVIISNNIVIEASKSEQPLLDIIANLGLIMLNN